MKHGFYYYGARYYNPRESLWLSVDPLFEMFSGRSTYEYTFSNPVNFIDPDGRSANPVYDENGNFLGTDDKGLQGEAIIINKKDFSQSMSHSTAMEKGTLLSNYNVELNGKGGLTENGKYQAAVFDRVNMHSLGLSKRPDYDGFLTLSEANEWYRTGEGNPLFVDASKINLTPVYNGDLPIGKQKVINFASPLYANFETGLVYGSIYLTPLNSEGSVKLGIGSLLDVYDFDKKKGGSTFRNVATWIGEQVAGKGTGYEIYNYGTGKLKDRPIILPPRD